MRKHKEVPAWGDKCSIRTLWIDKKTHRPMHYCMQHSMPAEKCEVCGNCFHCERRHTLTCSDKCRKAKSRATKRIQCVSVTL